MLENTTPKTLWSETLLEMLYLALDKQQSDKQILKLLTEIRGKGYKASYVVEKVTREIGAEAVPRLKKLIKQLKKGMV